MRILIVSLLILNCFALSARDKTESKTNGEAKIQSAKKNSGQVITFKADIASYQEVKSKNIFKGQGSAYLEIDDYQIHCEEIEIHFYQDEKGQEQVEKALFKKQIRIFNDKDQVQIGGEEAEYYRDEKKFVIRNNAFYTDSKDEVAVFGDTIYNYDEEGVTIIQGNTRIYQKDIFAKGAFVKYTKSDKQMSISGFPTVRNQGSEYRARKIIVDIENNTFILQGDLDAEILNNNEDSK